MNWPTAHIGDVAIINPPPGRPIGADERFAFLPMAAVSEHCADVRPRENRAGAELKAGFTYFEDGDLLVAKITPCFENGKIALAGTNLPGFASSEFHVLRASPTRVDSRYLTHFLRQPWIRELGKRRMTGSAGQQRVPRSFLEQLEIPLPPLSEQRRIAAILDAADALRAKRRAAHAKLDTLAQSIFVEMFGDPFKNTKQWRNGLCLGDVAEIVSGITKGRDPKGRATRPVPYLAVVNVQDRRLQLDPLKHIDATEDEITRYRLRPGDLLLTEGGDPDKLGRGTLWNDELPECIHQNHVFRVRLRSGEVRPTYLNWLVGSRYGKQYFLRSAKQTTGIASINTTQLRSFPLVMPPTAMQCRFEEKLSAVEGVKSAASGAQTDALFASLQHRAFAGQLAAPFAATAPS